MLRMSPFVIFADHWRGLADHRNGQSGRPDWTSRVAVLLFPLAAGVFAYGENSSIHDFSSDLVAAGGLLAALMIAVFVQMAAWRTRLDDRAFTHMREEAPTRRAVDATAADSLSGALTAVLATGLCVAGGILGPNRLVASAAATAGVYLFLNLLITLRMAYVAYQSVTDPAIKDGDDRLLRGRSVIVTGATSEPASAPADAEGPEPVQPKSISVEDRAQNL